MATFRVIPLVGAAKIGNLIDEGRPGSSRISTHLLNGDVEGALSALRETADYVLTRDGFSSLVTTLVKLGFLQAVVDNTPLKKSFTVFGMTFGL